MVRLVGTWRVGTYFKPATCWGSPSVAPYQAVGNYPSLPTPLHLTRKGFEANVPAMPVT